MILIAHISIDFSKTKLCLKHCKYVLLIITVSNLINSRHKNDKCEILTTEIDTFKY